MTEPTEKKYWLDDSRNVARVHWALVEICVLTVVADFFYDKHAHFRVENVPGSYAMIGFVSYVGLVLAAKQLRKILKRDESFYD